MSTVSSPQRRLKRRRRVRAKVVGTAEAEGIGGEVLCYVW